MNKEFLNKEFLKAYMDIYLKPHIRELFTPIVHEVKVTGVQEGERGRVEDQIPNHKDQTVVQIVESSKKNQDS